MNIVFMGSAPFSLPTLQALIDSPHTVAMVVAQPDKPAGRGQRTTSPVTIQLAHQHGLLTYQPASLRLPHATDPIRQIKPDVIVVVAYGKLLPTDLLTTAPLGAVNLHPSALPRYRGPSPIQWAIVQGDTETAITTMRLSDEMDAGDILLQEPMAISPTDTAATLHDRCANAGAALILATLEKLSAGTLQSHPQDHTQATFCPMLKKEDGHIEWSQPAQTIHNRIRGFTPWPGAYVMWHSKRLKILSTTPSERASTATPGSIIATSPQLVIATGDGSLIIHELQPEGKKAMSATDWVRGHTPALHDIFQ